VAVEEHAIPIADILVDYRANYLLDASPLFFQHSISGICHVLELSFKTFWQQHDFYVLYVLHHLKDGVPHVHPMVFR
jgi:hypothetical protein